ncbi:ABC transporter ATP-binding protein [Histidinibacterium aquaticum]|uniref:sn-glycerol-3-phosphate ABC transporter ATP-binding protein UgpC n=1 Tax=Histidinibacterium aquaticum TaxID=2613962 RepID=A0A5J5GPT7_9RHOB|nr:sn-glycerol-3-phosphate ABC transporter ATP-binding protein UgpC [Histidinibacterium aquaticum]KAA9010349.1 sn-glycerol-3-phosphate ABC transporter ATP-binding protein UgpC [Histidinibacterium aquaticum]
MGRIQLERVGKSYGGVDVLGSIDIDIEDGEFVVLVGPSGCGKSTLLRMVAGLEDITRGRIVIDGKVANRIPAKERGLAMVFQSYALYPHMKVADNMSFSLRLAGAPKAAIDAKVKEAAGILGLEHLLDRLPKELSGGQRQRVAMGRAIVRDPEAFLFDEPLSNLDAKLRVRMRSEIKKLHQKLGKTTLYVTHDQTEAMTMADRIVVLNDGGIAQMGPPEELYDNPISEFVASFIGSPEISLFRATSAGPRATHVDLGQGLTMPLPRPLDLPEGRPVTYGIRPQTITIADHGPLAEVQLVEPTGETADVSLTVAGQNMVAVLPTSAALRQGDRIHLGIPSNRALVFDPDTGGRLL